MKITQEINPKMFREYDLRGVFGVDINEDVSYTIGKSFGTYIQNMGEDTTIIGHDNRNSSPTINKALIQGIIDTGINVISLGLVTTPMYYFGISAQLKTVIDRFYAINEELHKPKKAALLMTYADTVEKEAEPTTLHFEAILNYLGWENIGEIIASGVWEAGSISNTHYPQQAYDLGKSL